MDFENVKDRVCFKLINKDRNAELLSDMPYIEFLDLAVTFYEMESVYEDDICPMYVATNSKKLNGACVMLYDGLLRDFARKVGKSFYIIPSSIHEVILIPDTLDMDIRYMKAMVKEVNGTEVAPDEVLSDNVYRYDIDTDRIGMM